MQIKGPAVRPGRSICLSFRLGDPARFAGRVSGSDRWPWWHGWVPGGCRRAGAGRLAPLLPGPAARLPGGPAESP